MKSIIKFFLFLIFFSTFQCSAKCTDFDLKFTKSNIPFVDIKIGEKNVPFIFDLGMKHGMAIDSKVLKNLTNHHIKFTKKNHIDVLGRKTEFKMGVIKSLQLNDINFRNINLSIYEPWGVEFGSQDLTRKDIKNVIGRDLFLSNQGIFLYSRKNQKIRWCDQAQELDTDTSSKIIWVPLKEDDDGLHVILTDRNKTVDFILDSAATLSLIKQSFNFDFSSCDYNFGEQDCQVMENQLQLGSLPIKVNVYQFPLSTSIHADGILGDNFFINYDLIIDTFTNRLGISPST